MSLRRSIAEVDVATLNVSEFCRTHGIGRTRFYEIRARYEAEGDAGLELGSRAPHRVANRTPEEVEDLIIRLRKDLLDVGLDCGAESIADRLAPLLPPGATMPATSTIWRILTRRGFIVPEPNKAPNRAGRSFAAERANECWQIDVFNWTLADGTPVKVFDVIDDCTRLAVGSYATPAATTTLALDAIAHAAARWGWPERVLSDNGSEFAREFETSLGALGIRLGHSRPYHPQTCGKVERFHQTVKRYLRAHPPARTIEELQALLDAFAQLYNTDRPHRSLGRRFPLAVWNATPKSGPADRPLDTPTQVVTNIVSNGRVFATDTRISIGAAYNGQPALVVTTGRQAHVFVDGALVRELTIEPGRPTQPLHPRPGRPRT